MTTLTDFLFARIVDDAALATRASHIAPDGPDPAYPSLLDPLRLLQQRFDPPRVLADCEAKRKIVELHPEGEHDCPGQDWTKWPTGPCLTLRALAQPYASHPDYQAEWRP